MTAERPRWYRFLTQRCAAFGWALTGIRVLFRTQIHALIHLGATVLAVAAGICTGLTTTEWSILSLAIGLVWVAEALNTAVEFVVDLASPEYHELAGKAKDLAAAAVLLAAVTAVLCGLALFGPELLTWVKG